MCDTLGRLRHGDYLAYTANMWPDAQRTKRGGFAALVVRHKTVTDWPRRDGVTSGSLSVNKIFNFKDRSRDVVLDRILHMKLLDYHLSSSRVLIACTPACTGKVQHRSQYNIGDATNEQFATIVHYIVD